MFQFLSSAVTLHERWAYGWSRPHGVGSLLGATHRARIRLIRQLQEKPYGTGRRRVFWLATVCVLRVGRRIGRASTSASSRISIKAANDRILGAIDHPFVPNDQKPSADCAFLRSKCLLANSKIDPSNPNIRGPRKPVSMPGRVFDTRRRRRRIDYDIGTAHRKPGRKYRG